MLSLHDSGMDDPKLVNPRVGHLRTLWAVAVAGALIAARTLQRAEGKREVGLALPVTPSRSTCFHGGKREERKGSVWKKHNK
jgi:hypothetical protein